MKSESSQKLLTKTQAHEAFLILNKRWPDAHCELGYNNDFQLLIAVVLSAQTTDKAVNKALLPLFEKMPQFGPQDLVDMGEDAFREVIKTIGFGPTKAKNCYKLSQILLTKHAGKVPFQREFLEELPGVGRKTANVVLNVLCGLPTMAVDTHVARLAVRIGFVKPTEDRRLIEDELLKLLPEEVKTKAHHQLIFHGRYHCTARAPKCSDCPLEGLCKKVGVGGHFKLRT
jgi:endonuclease-3